MGTEPVSLSIRFRSQNVEDWGSSPHLNQLRLTLVVAPICHFCAVFLGSRDVMSREKSARTWRNGKKTANSLDWPILSASTAQTMNCASRVRSDSQLASYPIHFLNRIGRRRKPSEASYTTESKLKRTAQTIIYIVGSVGNRWVGQLRRISSWCEAGFRQLCSEPSRFNHLNICKQIYQQFVFSKQLTKIVITTNPWTKSFFLPDQKYREYNLPKVVWGQHHTYLADPPRNRTLIHSHTVYLPCILHRTSIWMPPQHLQSCLSTSTQSFPE